MIERLYVDNYKALVNFEVRFGPVNLLLGTNGSGKSTIFEVIAKLRAVVGGEQSVLEAFPVRQLTRWDARTIQTFEIDLRTEQGLDRYRLEIDQGDVGHTRRSARIRLEQLKCNDALAFEKRYDRAQLYRDNGSPGPEVLADWSRSSLYQIHPRADNLKLTEFKEGMRQLHRIAIDPWVIKDWSEAEESAPSADMSNLTAWFRHLAQEEPGQMAKALSALQEVLGGLQTMRAVSQENDARMLITAWNTGTPASSQATFRLSELSEGQRALMALYIIYFAFDGKEATICLDEPENFVALSEIQPFFNQLGESHRVQWLLSSHHPEIINLAAVESGLVLRRDAGGPVRVAPFEAKPDERLTPAELVARGLLVGEGVAGGH